MFALMSTALGVALLGLPYAVKESGIISVIFFIITGGLISLWSMYVLANAGLRNNISSYPDLVSNVMGKVLIIFIFLILNEYLRLGIR